MSTGKVGAIRSVAGASSIYSAGSGNQSSTSTQFAEILANMKKSMNNGAASSEGSTADGEESITKFRRMPDGTLLLEVIKGSKVVSQTRLGEPLIQDGARQTLEVMADGSMQLVDHFNDTSSSMRMASGALFTGIA